jgi:hypothetical protein
MCSLYVKKKREDKVESEGKSYNTAVQLLTVKTLLLRPVRLVQHKHPPETMHQERTHNIGQTRPWLRKDTVSTIMLAISLNDCHSHFIALLFKTLQANISRSARPMQGGRMSHSVQQRMHPCPWEQNVEDSTMYATGLPVQLKPPHINPSVLCCSVSRAMKM